MNEQDYIVNSFTKEGDQTNLEVNHLDVSCIASKENNFELDSEGNLTVKSITTLNGIKWNNEVLGAVYPVGSIYMNVSPINPGTIFGGVWEQLKDRFLLGTGDTYQNGIVGGESTHTLSIPEMPLHEHSSLVVDNTLVAWGMPSSGDSINLYQSNPFTLNRSASYSNIRTSVTGENKPHNNMPPYLTVYMWKRVA